MSLALALLFGIGATLVGVTRKETFAIRDELGLTAAPELHILTILLIIFSLLKVVVAGGLCLVVFFPCVFK